MLCIYSSKLKAAIDSPSDRSSTSILSFGFRSLVLQNHERYSSGRHLLDEVSSKLRLCGFLPWLVQGLHDGDITIQATNWLADGHVPKIIRHALTALSSYNDNASLEFRSCIKVIKFPKSIPQTT